MKTFVLYLTLAVAVFLPAVVTSQGDEAKKEKELFTPTVYVSSLDALPCSREHACSMTSCALQWTYNDYSNPNAPVGVAEKCRCDAHNNPKGEKCCCCCNICEKCQSKKSPPCQKYCYRLRH